MKKALFIIASIFIMCSCDNTEIQNTINELVCENDSLKKVISNLEKEVECYKNSPEKLFASAEELYRKNDLNSLKEIKNKLAKYHPESKEFEEVSSYINEIERKENEEIEKARIKAEKEAKAELEKRMAAVNKMKKNFDDVSGTTWYEPKTYTHYNNRNLVSLYIGKKEFGTPWLRLKMSYCGDDWIFFENAYLSYDGNTKEIEFDRYDNKKSDNSGGEVWEWIDVSVDHDLLTFLKKMVDGKSIKMRLSGKYTKTRNLSNKEINEIKDALLAYDVLLNG